MTNSSGIASVPLTLRATAGQVSVSAEGPYGLGHPVVAFTETAQYVALQLWPKARLFVLSN